MASILAEVERTPGACPHIAEPQPPTLLYGVTPSEAGKEAQAWAEQATDSRGHKLRKDGLCILGGVISLPAGMADRWGKYKADCLKWLKREYGDRLRSVVEHTDEAHPHLHFYAVPRVGERFAVVDPARAAADAADPDRGKRGRDKAEAKVGRKAARLAYIAAKRGWQDRLYESVSRRYGLARIGPARRRLTRGEWQAEKAAGRAVAARYDDLAAKDALIARGTEQARKVVEEAKAAGAAADAAARKLVELEATHAISKRFYLALKGLSPDQVRASIAALEAEAARQQSRLTPTGKTPDRTPDRDR